MARAYLFEIKMSVKKARLIYIMLAINSVSFSVPSAEYIHTSSIY